METNFYPNYSIHPGVFLKEEMEVLKISQKALAEKIGISKTIINEVIHGKRKISGELAVKLEQVLYSPASYWLNLQSIYDEAEARKKLKLPSAKPIKRTMTYSQYIDYNYYYYEARCIA